MPGVFPQHDMIREITRKGENSLFQSVKQLALYGIFGVLTTAIDIFAYWAVSRYAGLGIAPSAAVAWVIAVSFAYWSNRNFVFTAKTHTLAGMFREASEFFMCRIATGVFEVSFMYIFADVLKFDDVITKAVSNIIAIMLNFIASRYFIFREEKSS